MPDILILPDASRPWTLGLHKGVVVRLPCGPVTPRVLLTLACHCGDQTDNPADLARMRATYDREERMNA